MEGIRPGRRGYKKGEKALPIPLPPIEVGQTAPGGAQREAYDLRPDLDNITRLVLVFASILDCNDSSYPNLP